MRVDLVDPRERALTPSEQKKPPKKRVNRTSGMLELSLLTLSVSSFRSRRGKDSRVSRERASDASLSLSSDEARPSSTPQQSRQLAVTPELLTSARARDQIIKCAAQLSSKTKVWSHLAYRGQPAGQPSPLPIEHPSPPSLASLSTTTATTATPHSLSRSRLLLFSTFSRALRSTHRA